MKNNWFLVKYIGKNNGGQFAVVVPLMRGRATNIEALKGEVFCHERCVYGISPNIIPGNIVKISRNNLTKRIEVKQAYFHTVSKDKTGVLKRIKNNLVIESSRTRQRHFLDCANNFEEIFDRMGSRVSVPVVYKTVMQTSSDSSVVFLKEIEDKPGDSRLHNWLFEGKQVYQNEGGILFPLYRNKDKFFRKHENTDDFKELFMDSAVKKKRVNVFFENNLEKRMPDAFCTSSLDNLTLSRSNFFSMGTGQPCKPLYKSYSGLLFLVDLENQLYMMQPNCNTQKGWMIDS